ncbi:beta-ketoacyl-ACP synthase II [Geotoga petraea]|jgi:3-oxoacyl-[acyl-carrier-protein] synthase II|uniref:3-oxoacyl-[acyl-carrier-protein] synthase 2 n=1 Tax=Geotoga petraea TaxID=28234 RepID=A0A1G6L0D8_9BACT|nr:beta-ketoacyl-ACP synthase II [Geotoga petraea]TGG88795.1 beta-ketoacyl-[acyl-carrier-protein] synthase II [Geotoga petraea]SDC36637.1 3-oxoacyl-[acyl-carrier-protein] synthase II [Geotoga petraea]
MKKVVVTGIGTINAIAKNKDEMVNSLKEMKIGIDKITQFDTSEHKVSIAAEVKDFDPKQYMDKKKARRYDRVLQFAMVSSQQALEDSKLPEEGDWKENAAVLIASGIGGFKTLNVEFEKLHSRGPKSVSPFLIPMMIADMASGVVSIENGIKGPNYSTMSACASAVHAIINATMMIKHGYIDVALAGGTEACIDPMPIAAFANMTALSQRNDDPKTASRPFDKNRDGFVMGEGSSTLILESEEHALARGAKIYGYIEGFGMSGDAYHISKSDPEGKGAAKAMKQAIEMAGITPEQIDLINAHATSTPVGDQSEIKALRDVMGDSINNSIIQSNKTLFGHSLGAAGANELVASIIESENGFAHGMPNLFERDDEFIGLNIPNKTINADIKYILKNSFGFGGHNACLVYRKK